VKIGNSTKWSNLFLTELKSDYRLKPELIATELMIGLIVISIALFNFIYFDKALVSWQLTTLTLCVGYLTYVLTKKLFLVNKTYNVIQLNGFNCTVVYNGKTYEINRQSRVSFLGGFLVLTEPQKRPEFKKGNKAGHFFGQTSKDKLVFIDKRFMDKQQFSTLCFTLNRMRHLYNDE
jgi:hypothetical protein